MPNYLVELEDGRKFQVEADSPPTSDDLTQYFSAQQPVATEKPFLDISETASALGRAATSLATTVPSSLSQAWSGLDNPWKRSEGYLQSQQGMRDLQEELDQSEREAELSGDASTVSSTIREAIPSLGFSGATLIPSLGAGAGTLALTRSPNAARGAAAATSAIMAYRMAGAQFLDDAKERIDAYFQENLGRLPNEQEQNEAYDELLPLARKFGAAEAGPEALGNLALGGAGKYIRRALGGKGGVMELASNALGKVTGTKAALAGAGALASEIGTEAVTAVEQDRINKQFEEGIMRGESPESVQLADRSPQDYVEGFKEVAPTTTALTAMMGAAGLAPTAISRGIQSLRRPQVEQAEQMPTPEQVDPGITAAEEMVKPTAAVPGAEETAILANEQIDEANALAKAAAAVIEGMSPPPVKSAIQPVEEAKTPAAEVSGLFDLGETEGDLVNDFGLELRSIQQEDRQPAETLFELPPPQKRNLGQLRDAVIRQMDETQSLVESGDISSLTPEYDRLLNKYRRLETLLGEIEAKMLPPSLSPETPAMPVQPKAGEAPLSEGAQRNRDVIAEAAAKMRGKAPATTSPGLQAVIPPQTTQEDALPIEIPATSVLREERPEMELQGVGEQNAQPEEVATEGQQEEVATKSRIKLGATPSNVRETAELIQSLLGTEGELRGEVYTDDGARVRIIPFGNMVMISEIEVPENLRGAGVASGILDKIISIADEKGVNLGLSPKPFGKIGLSENQLSSWYEKNGFRPSKRQGILQRSPQQPITPQGRPTTATEGQLTSGDVGTPPSPVAPVATGEPVQAAPSAAQAVKATAPGPVSKPAQVEEAPRVSVDIPKEGIGSIYERKVNGGQKWLVQESDSRGFGDSIHDSKEEAEKYSILEARRKLDRADAIKYLQQQEDDKVAKKIAAEKMPREFTKDRVAGGVASERAVSVLTQTASRRSASMGKMYSGTKAEIAQEMVADGYIPSKEGKKFSLDRNNGESVFIVTKTEAEYAQWLIDTQQSSKKPEVKSLPDAIIRQLLSRGSEVVPSGPSFAGFRQLLMEKMGTPVPRSKAGVNAVTKALAEFLGVDTNDSIRGVEQGIRTKLKDMMGAGSPTPQQSPQTTPVATQTETAVPSAKGTAVASVGSNLAGGRSSELPASKTPETQPSTKENDAVAKIARLVSSGAKPEEMDKFVKSLTDDQFNELIDKGMYDASPNLRIEPQDSNQEKSRKKRKFVKQVVDVMAVKASRKSIIDSVIDKDKTNIKYGKVTRANAEAARNLLNNSGQIPNAFLTRIYATPEEFLNDRNNQRLYPSAYARMMAEPNVEGLYADKTTFVFASNIGVSNLDRNIGTELGISAEQAAARRVILHENGHRGVDLFDPSELREFRSFVNRTYTAEEIDNLVRLYTEYADWRTNPRSRDEALEEIFQKKFERLTKIPTGGIWDEIVEFLKRVWRRMTGRSGDPTLKDMKDVVRLLRNAMKRERAPTRDYTLKNGGEVRLSLSDENKFENKPSLVINPRASSSYSGRGVASIPPSDNSARAQAIREGVSRANWDELSTTQRAKALEEFGLKSISSRYSFDAAILPVRLTNERTDENRPVSVYAAEPSPAIAIQFDASRLSNLLSGDAVTAFAAIYDIAQEEVIHTAQHLNAYAKWQDSGVMLPFEEFEVNYYTSMLLEMVQAAGAGLSGGDARVANIIVSAWNLYNPNVPSNDVNQIIGNLVQTKTAPAFTMEIGRQLLQFKRQDFTTETGWMRFVEAMKGYLADAVEALKTSLSLVRSGQAGEMIRREIQDVESILNRLETNPDSILPDAKPSRVEYASDYSEATSAGAQLARDTIYDDRIIEMRDAIRRAYEQSSTEAGVAIPLDELYAKAKELVPEMTENEFGNILQDLYEDNGAVLQEGESAFDVFTPEGRRAGFAIIMPKRAVASRVETEGEAVDEYKKKIEAIDSNSLNAFFGGRQVKGASPQVRTVKPSKSYEQAAIELVNDLTKDRTPIEDIAESLFSDEFLQGLGIKLDIPALVSLIAEVKNRVSNQSRDDKIPGARRIKLQKLDRKLAGYWQDLGTNSGRSQGIRSYITRNPRYSWMFIFDRANENLEKEGKLAATRVASDLPQTAENLQKTDAKVGEDAGEQAADDLEDDQDDIDLAEGEATLDQKGKTLWEKFKDLIRKRGIAMRALNALRAGNKAKASISSEERNAISQMSEEELVKFIAGIDKEMADVFDEFTKAPATRKKREKMVATAKKRAEQGKPIEPKQSAAKEKLSGAERTAQNILKDLSERYADPNIYTDAKRAKINEMRELYKKRVKQGVGPEQMSEQDFVSKAVSLGANKLTAETLWKAAELEIEAREAMRQEEVLGKITLEKLQREISALRPGEKAPFSKQIPWRKLLSQKASTVETYRQRVFDTISSEESLSDLDEAQKAKLADLLTQAWESKRKAILDRMVDNAISQEQAAGRLTKEGADALRSQRQKLVEDINLGILDEDRLMKHLADKFGIKSEFTEAERVNIDRLLDILQDDKLNEVKRNKAGYELLEALSSVTKIPIAKLLADYWVSSVLSGVNTAASIAMAVMSGGYELTSGAFRILRAGFTNPKELPAEIAASFKAMAEFLKAFGREGRLAWQYLVTGDRAFLDPSMNTVLNDLNYDSIGKTVSLAEKMAKSDKIMQRVMGIWMRSVSRLLTALDSFNSGVTKAGALPIVFRQLNLDAESLKQATEKYNLKLYREKAIQEDFDNKQPTNQHEKALVDSYAKARMMADLQEFGKFSENADFFGQQGAMTLDPTGIGGFIYSSIKSLTGGATDRADKFLAEAEREWKQADGGDKTAKGLQLAFAYFLQFGAYNSANLAGLRFARFAGNKFNQGLSFIPGIGMLRMYESTAKDSKIEAKDAFTDMIMRNQLAGLLLSLAGFAVIQAIMDEPDDEKRGWFINGGWANLTPDRKQQKLAAGQKEFTIGIGGKVYNYQNWPISPILAAIGSLSDLIRYSRDQWNEKSIADRLVSAAASGVFSAGEIPALSGFQTLFGNNLSSKDPNEKRLDRFAKVMAGWGGGFVPRILKDVDFMTDPGLRKYESLWEQTASHIPVYRRYSGEEYYDILGKQIERKVWPGSREFMELETDPEYRTLGKLNSRGIWLTPANAEHRMVGKGRFKRKLTQEEADAYSLETGKGYRQMLLRYGSRLEQMPTERARAFLMDKADEVRDRALQKITR